MYCKSCGLQIENDSRFCRRCGNEITGDISIDHGTAPAVNQKKIILAAGIAILLLVVAVLLILFRTMEESPDSKVINPSTHKNLAFAAPFPFKKNHVLIT